MKVYTHSTPLSTQKLMKFMNSCQDWHWHTEVENDSKKGAKERWRDFCHLSCTWKWRRGWKKRILKQLKCYWDERAKEVVFFWRFYERWQFRNPSLLLFHEVNPLSLTFNAALHWEIVLPSPDQFLAREVNFSRGRVFICSFRMI